MTDSSALHLCLYASNTTVIMKQNSYTHPTHNEFMSEKVFSRFCSGELRPHAYSTHSFTTYFNLASSIYAMSAYWCRHSIRFLQKPPLHLAVLVVAYWLSTIRTQGVRPEFSTSLVKTERWPQLGQFLDHLLHSNSSSYSGIVVGTPMSQKFIFTSGSTFYSTCFQFCLVFLINCSLSVPPLAWQQVACFSTDTPSGWSICRTTLTMAGPDSMMRGSRRRRRVVFMISIILMMWWKIEIINDYQLDWKSMMVARISAVPIEGQFSRLLSRL